MAILIDGWQVRGIQSPYRTLEFRITGARETGRTGRLGEVEGGQTPRYCGGEVVRQLLRFAAEIAGTVDRREPLAHINQEVLQRR